jgi:ABC-type xylose transport system permease subunit
MASLTDGMNLLGTDISVHYMVSAIVLALAVLSDVSTRKAPKWHRLPFEESG